VDRIQFRSAKVEVLSNVSLRHDERVADRNRIVISDRKAEFVLQKNASSVCDIQSTQRTPLMGRFHAGDLKQLIYGPSDEDTEKHTNKGKSKS
jgi:hypothetical protein